MKRIIIAFLLTVYILVIVCTKKDTIAPESDDDYTEEATETIGPTGGSIETEDFILSIPAGAFDASYELSLSSTLDDTTFGGNSITRSFLLQGLPDEYSKPLRLSIKYEGSMTEESFVAVGEWVYDALYVDSTIIYSLQSAVDSSGYLVAELPTLAQESSAKSSVLYQSNKQMTDLFDEILLIGITNYRSSTPSPHFKIYCPEYLGANVPAIKQLMEDNYDVIEKELGFYFEERDWDWPMKVVVIHMTQDARGGYLFLFGTNGIYISWDSMEQSRFSEIKQAAGPPLLDFLLYSYVGFDVFYSNTFYWLRHAVLNWSEERFTDNTNYQHPRNFPKNEMAPFNGMKAGAGNERDLAKVHGRGMSAVIKYLVDDPRFGVNGLASTFASITDNEDPTATLLSNVNGHQDDWWPEFFRAYVSGNIYNVSSAIFTDDKNLSGVWSIDDEKDTKVVFDLNYPDLSAKLFMINLNYAEIDESADMLLELSGTNEPLSLLLFGIKDGTLEYLGDENDHGSATLQIESVRGFIDNGYKQFLVVAVNSDVSPSYTLISAIELTISVTEAEAGLPYNRCYINVGVNSHIQRVWGETTSEYDSPQVYASPYKIPVGIEGHFQGNTFEGSYNSESGHEGFVEITLNASQNTVTSIAWTDTLKESSSTSATAFIGTDIPKTVPVWADLEFKVEGTAACSHISYLKHTFDNPVLELYETLLSHTCGDDSHVMVWLWEE